MISSYVAMGVKASGTVNESDFAQLTPKVEALTEAQGSIGLLLDVTEFHWEEIHAWGADLQFGQDFHGKILKLAIVGDKGWEKWVTKLAAPFYAQNTKYFQNADMDSAWAWLRE